MKRNIILSILFLLAAGQTGFAVEKISRQEALSLFAKAGLAYKDGRYDEAVRDYEQILAGGLENGNLYYNLGNSYYKKGSRGLAILHYERALRLIPRDPDTRSNYHYAVSEVRTSYRPGTLSGGRHLLLSVSKVLTVDEIMAAVLFLLVGAGVVHLLALYFSWPRTKVVPILVGLFIGAGILLSAGVARIFDDSDLAVVVKATAARFEPTEKATVHFDLVDGEKVRVEKQDGAWLKIRRGDDKAGWVPGGSAVRI